MARRVDRPFIIPRRQGTTAASNPSWKRGGRGQTNPGLPASSQSTGFIDDKLIQGSQTQSQVSPFFSRFTRQESRGQEGAYCAGGLGAQSQSYSQSQKGAKLGFLGHSTQRVEEFEDVEDGDVQLDAFDLELLAHPNDGPTSFQPTAPSSAEYFPSYQPQQAEPSSQVSRFLSGPRVTPHRTMPSSSSDTDTRDASSPLVRLQPGRGSGILRGHDYEVQSPILQAFQPQSTIETPIQHDQNTPFQDIPVSIRGIVLISVHELPDNYRSLFNFPVFNAVQSKCFQNVYKGDDNVVLAAPTGSGKTVVMELAICRLQNTLKDEQFKIVYQAPTKSLCSERFRDWSRKFQTLNLQCAELTGDTDSNSLRNVQNSQIIITTPEKWDSMTRKWKDHARLMQMVKLFLIDEVHTLKEARGATLEAVVSRMKSIGSNVRFVALSATIPNSEDIAIWLGRNASNQHVPAHREHFGEQFRPVKLQKFVYGHQSHLNDFAFDKFLNSKLAEVIGTHSAKKPIMIFCCTRNSAVTTAKELAKLWSMSNHPARLWRGPNSQMPVTNTDLKTTTIAGVAFHHAGLDPSDRRQVETGYIAGKLSIICCTSTLAVGVNLPCHLVIIKNTVGWQDGCCKEYSDLEVMQMLGRAGRPQFDDSATAVILTRKERVDHYEKLVSGSEGLESCLHLNLIEHLNAEIGLGNVNSLETATGWLAGTFLFVRLRRNPTHYKLKEGANRNDEDEMLRQICEKDIKLLQECDLIDSNSLKSTPLGDAMARYYIRFETMQTIRAMKPQSDVAQILSTMSQAEEFRNVRLKAGEKSVYKELNRSRDIRYPINVDIALPCHKISLIIQSELGAVEFPNAEQFQKYKFAFQQDRNFVFSHVNRVIRCIIDCQVHLEDGVTTRNASELARSLAARVWDDSPLQMKQIEQIGIVAVRKLTAAGIDSIQVLEETEPHQIDMALSKNPPFGMKLRARLAEFPKLRVSVKMAGKDIKAGRSVKVRFKAEIAFMNKECPLYFQKRPVYVCFIAETSDGRLIDFRRISAHRLKTDHEVFLTAELKACDQYISCHVMCDEIAGTSRSARLESNIPRSCFSKSDEGTGALLADESQVGVAREPYDGKSSSKIDETNLDQYDIDDLLFGEWLDPVPNDTASRKEGARLDKATERNSNIDREPEKLENGRWACNHKCKDKTSCKHLCCREGLTNPPKPPKKKPDEDRNERTESKQLKLSASITKPKHADDSPAQLPGSKNAIGDPVSLAVDSSSDYGDESFDSFPSPLAALLGDSESSLEHLPQVKSGDDQAGTSGLRQKRGWTHVGEGPFRAQLANDELTESCLIDLISSESQEPVSPSQGVGKTWSKKRTLEDGTDSGEHDQANNDSSKRAKNSKAEPETKKAPQNSEGEDDAADGWTFETQTSPMLDDPPVPTDWDGIDPALLEDFKDIVDFF
ncbi:Sec63 Brl domain-containing protein [Aspergillus venezuelensis]